ncbi:MAG: hypothetical protein HYZ91_01140 [Candidatus Omnitrophica bacterium]|nr:hypothetical protein [Candidatus Omnitrophota bacterium]
MLAALKRLAPAPVKSVLRSAMRLSGRHWSRPRLVGQGTIQDLYYWVCDDRVETNVLLNNFYSIFFPTLETATTGSVTVFEYGTILFHLDIPPAVLEALREFQAPFYFWHRFYIEFVTRARQPAFVHCVDKTLILRHGNGRTGRWYPQPQPRDWAPELPVNLEDYQRLLVILINRTPRTSTVRLAVADTADRLAVLSAEIPPCGVHRFALSRETLPGLNPHALRLRVCRMPTRWARPVLFKEFANGTISTMHC